MAVFELYKLLNMMQGLVYHGTVTAVPGANQFTLPGFIGMGAGKFADATNPYYAFVLRDAGGAAAAPQGEQQDITAFDSATGVFTTGAFTAAVAVDDEILIVNPNIGDITVILAALGVAGVDSTDNVYMRDPIGNKEDTPKLIQGTTFSIEAYIKALVMMYTGTPITTYTDANNFAATGLIGMSNTTLAGWWVQCVYDAGGTGAAPQTEWEQITAYVSATGAITHNAFSANLAVNDRIKIVPPEVYESLTIRGGANTIQSVMDEFAAVLDLARSAQSGTLTLDGTEQTLYEETDTNPFEFGGGKVDLFNQAAGDTVILRQYVKIKSGGVYRLETDDTVNTYAGVQAVPIKKFDRQYNVYGIKITIEHTVVAAAFDVDHEWFDLIRSA